MQKKVIIPVDRFIEDLGTGHSYVNFNRLTKTVTDMEGTRTFCEAGEQYYVAHPITLARIVNTVVKESFQDGESEAAIRKGISNSADPDFVAFNVFVEGVKQKCRDEGIQ